MTMPIERTAALMEVRSFLNALTNSSEVSAEIKRQASRALRHYPSAREVNMLAEKRSTYAEWAGQFQLIYSLPLSLMRLAAFRSLLRKMAKSEPEPVRKSRTQELHFGPLGFHRSRGAAL